MENEENVAPAEKEDEQAEEVDLKDAKKTKKSIK